MHSDRFTLVALYAGVAAPILYYGVQAAAVPFYPGFSFKGTTASELGSGLSSHPDVFNYGVMLQGIANVVASVGFFMAYRRLGNSPLLAWPTALAVAICGLGSVWAGYYPLPDPRHGGHPAFLIAFLASPMLLTVTLWKNASLQLRLYLVANLLLLVVMVPIISGKSGLDTSAYRGLIQRLFALTIFLPIGVAAFDLAARIKALPRG